MNLVFLDASGESPVDYKKFLYSKNFNPGFYGVSATVLFLKEMFKSNPEFGFTVHDDSLSKEMSFGSILITTKFDWEVNCRSKRPAVFVSRGNLIAGVNGTTGQGKMFSIEENGAKTSYTDIVSFPIMVECISESDIQAEALAAMVASFITLDVRPFRSLGFQIQGTPTISSPQIFEKGNTAFICSTIIQVQMARSYKARVISSQALTDIQVILNGSTQITI